MRPQLTVHSEPCEKDNTVKTSDDEKTETFFKLISFEDRLDGGTLAGP